MHLIKGQVTVEETVKPVKVTIILGFLRRIESNQWNLNFSLAYKMGKYYMNL